MDILLLLSLFTGRDVFAVDSEIGDGAIIRDPRKFTFGGILRTSIPYISASTEFGEQFNIGFEQGLSSIYHLMRSSDWQIKYKQGYFLILALHAFKRQPLEANFIQCWTIWEHLFALHNQSWLSNKQIRQISSSEKISYILVKYALSEDVDNSSRKVLNCFEK